MRPSQSKKSKISKYADAELTDAQTFRIIGSATTLVENYKCELNPPLIIFMGNQAVGKSHVLGRLSEQKGTYSRVAGDDQNQPKTRFPVHHTHRYVEGPHYTVTGDLRGINTAERAAPDAMGGINIPAANLTQEVSTILRAADAYIMHHGILQTGVYLDIHISGPDLKNMHFIDLPGMSHTNVGYNNYIASTIDTFTKRYTNSIRVIVTTAIDAAGCSLWHKIREMPDTHNVVWVITRPDGLGAADTRLKTILDTPGTFCGVPQSNVFILKSYDTTNVAPVHDEDSAEQTFFSEHPIYGPMTREEKYKGQFGIANLRSFIYSRLKAVLRGQLPKIEETLVAAYAKCKKGQDEIMVTPMSVDPDSRRVASNKIFMEFLSHMRKMFDGDSGFGNDDVLAIRNKVSIDFRRDIQKITYNLGISDDGILLECSRAGGVVKSVGAFTLDTFHHLMFNRPDSPYSALCSVIRTYVEDLDGIFRKIVDSIRLPAMAYVDDKYWKKFRKHLGEVFTQTDLAVAIESFCVVQKHNYKNYFEDNSPGIVPVAYIEDRKMIPIAILRDFWQDVKNNVCCNFPKYVAEFLIDRNIRALDTSSEKAHVRLAQYLVERSDALDKRKELAGEMRTIEDVFATIEELKHSVTAKPVKH